MSEARSLTATPVIDALWPAEGLPRAVRLAIVAVVGSALLTLSAKIHVPFWPVPMTMQTYAALVLGMALGPRLGATTVLLYLAQGAVGLPVFSGTPERGLGLAYMAGPTGGYLLGFAVAAWVVGTLGRVGWDRALGRAALAMALGTVIIFAFGLAWLSALIGFEKAIELGLMPFLPAAALKLALGAATLPLAWRVADRLKR